MHLGCIGLATCATTHTVHHIHCLLHHFRIIHHFFHHGVIHHLRHIAHVRQLLLLATSTHKGVLLLLNRGLRYKLAFGRLSGAMSVLGLLCTSQHIRVIFSHLSSLSDRIRRQISHHLLKLLISKLHTVHRLILLAHHGWICSHHVDHVVNLVVVHLIQHFDAFIYILNWYLRHLRLLNCGRLKLWLLLYFFNKGLIIDFNTLKEFIFSSGRRFLLFLTLLIFYVNLIFPRLDFIKQSLDRLVARQTFRSALYVFESTEHL